MRHYSSIENMDVASQDDWTSVLIAFGSNQGDVVKNVNVTLQKLGEIPSLIIERVSSVYRTCPVGGPAGQEDFLNGAVLARVRLSPQVLLEQLQGIEKELKRVRVEFWGARTIDLDLIFYGSTVLISPTLILPHPRFFWRDFVLRPICEIAPNFIAPLFQLTVKEIFDLLQWCLRNYPVFRFDNLTSTKSTSEDYQKFLGWEKKL